MVGPPGVSAEGLITRGRPRGTDYATQRNGEYRSRSQHGVPSVTAAMGVVASSAACRSPFMAFDEDRQEHPASVALRSLYERSSRAEPDRTRAVRDAFLIGREAADDKQLYSQPKLQS